MKRCPRCGRSYYDGEMLYCLDDGSALVAGGGGEDTPTLIDPNVWAGAGPASLFNLPGASFARFEEAPANSIAVLPFANMSAEPENEYFCDGLAEELLNVLAKIRGLRVAARTSAFSFKGKRTTIGEIGRVLNVASVLEGSIRIVGNRIRISVQLVKVADGYQFWSQSYDRLMDDIFAVQDEIALSVVEELRTRLLGEDPGSAVSAQIMGEVAAAVKGRADDPEAQRLMFLGRAFLDRLTKEDTARAIECFQKALEIDPEYALCWAELSRAYSIEAGRAWVPIREAFDRSREAVQKALSIEPDLAEGHAQMGRIKLTHDFDIEGAETSYGRAINLAPGSSAVMDGFSVLEYKLDRLEEAVERGRRVLVQDPLSAAFWHNLGLTCHAAGRLEESEEAFARALKLVPQRLVSNSLLALVKMDRGAADEAIEQAKKEPYEMWRLWSLAILYHAKGDRSRSDESLYNLKEKHAEGNTYQIAEAHSMRGETEQAFTWLERAYEERDPGVTHSMVNPRLRPLHNDPRWAPFLRKIGFKVPDENA
jgi:TolB-like protein/Tfp pilus assembly protein PilF